jgi:hypothetical protein
MWRHIGPNRQAQRSSRCISHTLPKHFFFATIKKPALLHAGFFLINLGNDLLSQPANRLVASMMGEMRNGNTSIFFYNQNMKAISLKLDEKELKLLDELSRTTHIPKSALVRKGIRLVLTQAKEDIISAELKREIDSILREDSKLLKRLSKA